MKRISLKEMFEAAVDDALNGYPNGGKTFYWKDGDNKYHVIVECDLFRGRFITDNDDFSQFEWEIDDSHIYVDDDFPESP